MSETEYRKVNTLIYSFTKCCIIKFEHVRSSCKKSLICGFNFKATSNKELNVRLVQSTAFPEASQLFPEKIIKIAVFAHLKKE